MLNKKNFFMLTIFMVFQSAIVQASDPSWAILKGGYYWTQDRATIGSQPNSNCSIFPLTSQVGLKISWIDLNQGKLLIETTRSPLTGGDPDYAALHFQCTSTTCLSTEAPGIEILPDGSFVMRSWRDHLPMKFSFLGTTDQSGNVYQGFGDVGFWRGTYCSNTDCPEAYAEALANATQSCKSAGHSTCQQIWSEPLDFCAFPSQGMSSSVFVSVKGL